MAYLQGEHSVPQDMILKAAAMLGKAPVTGEVLSGEAAFTAPDFTWNKLVDQASIGPGLLWTTAIDPAGAGTALRVRIYIDGDLVHEATGLDTSTNWVVGIPFDPMDEPNAVASMFCAEGFEIWGYTINSAVSDGPLQYVFIPIEWT
jgi:hypothetical protein